MSEELKKGLRRKYKVEKISNPKEIIDAVVLEFDDKIACKGIIAWAFEMFQNGYEHVYYDTMSKISGKYGVEFTHDTSHKDRIKLQQENEKLKRGLHELVYDVFFSSENKKAVTDTLWHSEFTTSFDNISHLLSVDCSSGDMDKIEDELRKLTNGTDKVKEQI